VSSRLDEKGGGVLRGRLEPEVGALVIQALAAAREALYQKVRAAERERTGGTDTGLGDIPAGTSGLPAARHPPRCPPIRRRAFVQVTSRWA
jgi:hypothetical protein